MNILITICARGGSKGIPGKNIKELNGKPLIAYTIDLAKQIQNFIPNVDIALSTDSDEIMSVAERYGLPSKYKRPDNLADDFVGKIAVIADVLRFSEKEKSVIYDYVLDLDVTSPLRNIDDILKAFELIRNDPEAMNIFSVSEAARNPYFNMVEQQANGYFSQVKKKETAFFTRQSSPKVYDINGSFYIYRHAFFEKGYQEAITDKTMIYIMPHICFDLDHPIDYDKMSYLMENNKLDFSL
ncbi:MAG: acylneuraminate cytidylyltransferase family protein [Bacteroidales bacterium]|jgi:CMP-N-acetylneuraminic acid synthetase|nr:acylneuraminate cytidylyltransferase family protein [Bacteroidales bacterium]